jgi:hypothetical protein
MASWVLPQGSPRQYSTVRAIQAPASKRLQARFPCAERECRNGVTHHTLSGLDFPFQGKMGSNKAMRAVALCALAVLAVTCGPSPDAKLPGWAGSAGGATSSGSGGTMTVGTGGRMTGTGGATVTGSGGRITGTGGATVVGTGGRITGTGGRTTVGSGGTVAVGTGGATTIRRWRQHGRHHRWRHRRGRRS